MNTDIDHLRNSHRSARANISETVLHANAQGLYRQISTLREFRNAVNIASYIAIRGEIDTSLIMEDSGNGAKNFYLPVLRGDKMFFAPWRPGEALQKKGFGLMEPASTNWIDPTELDLVLTPLVVFDAACNRIGQGGGYYDRTFAHRMPNANGAGTVVKPSPPKPSPPKPSPPKPILPRPILPKPILLGVAHESQREPSLQPQTWDVPLDLVVTERSIYRA